MLAPGIVPLRVNAPSWAAVPSVFAFPARKALATIGRYERAHSHSSLRSTPSSLPLSAIPASLRQFQVEEFVAQFAVAVRPEQFAQPGRRLRDESWVGRSTRPWVTQASP